MKCVECKFWRRSDGLVDPDSGECRRHAPKPISEALAIVLGSQRNEAQSTTDLYAPGHTLAGWTDRIALWPRTFAGDFCGEAAPLSDRKGFV
jgi:hypothetical protein